VRFAWCALSLAAALALGAAVAAGDASHDVPSLFFVAKSENRNQVHYALRLDERCAPLGASPVQPYWRMLEQGARLVEPLLGREQPAYGIREQTVLERGDRGGVVRVVLRALPTRPVLVTSFARGAGCAATASLVIDGTPATLGSIYVQLGWLFGVDRLVVQGRALSDGRPVSETLVP